MTGTNSNGHKRRHEPRIFVFQMGKVGSSSVTKAVCGTQVHCLSWAGLRESLKGGYHRHQFNSLIMHFSAKKKIISAVRDPVARNLSAFMQNHLDRGWKPSMDSFLRNFQHDEPLEWFDREMKPYTGIDVFQHPFPHEEGWQIINDRLLIMRAEASDATKQIALRHFLGRDVTLGRTNVSSEKDYAGDYRSLRAQGLPREYVDHLLDSRYTRHFYSADEIEGFRARWYAGGEGA